VSTYALGERSKDLKQRTPKADIGHQSPRRLHATPDRADDKWNSQKGDERT
jgi:hypothetical protein